jgi:predicted  nucleic acid-binding Zn-ribbon protein
MLLPSAARSALLACVGLSLAALTPGCSQRKKVAECNALIGVVNHAVESIQSGARKAPDAGSADKDLRDMADAMTQIADEAAKLELSVAELKQFGKQYEQMAREVAAAAKDLATAIEKVDDEQMRKAQDRMEKAVQQEAPLVESINKFCRAP